MENSNKSKDMIIAFLSGALAGGVVTYLLQTDKGKEVVSDLQESAHEKIKETKEIISQTEAELKLKLHEALNKVDIDDAVAKGKETIDKIREK
jgi:gas vesicle protein